MINIYTKQWDNIISKCYSSYLADNATSNNILGDTTGIHINQQLSHVEISPNISTDTIYSFCIQNNIYIPGLISSEQYTILNILSNQVHHYFDMIHNHVVCFYTHTGIIHSTEHQFKYVCSQPYIFNITKVVIRFYLPHNIVAYQRFVNISNPINTSLYTITHINTLNTSCIVWDVKTTHSNVSHKNISEQRQNILSSINSQLTPLKHSDTYLQFNASVIDLFGLKKLSNNIITSCDYTIKSNHTSQYPIHIDLEYQTEIICKPCHVQAIVSFINNNHKGNLLLIPFKPTQYHILTFGNQSEVMMSIHIDTHYSNLILDYLNIPFVLSQSSTNLSDIEHKRINKFISNHQWCELYQNEQQQSYHEPQQSYHEPQQSYHEPQQSYHEPQQSYHEPQQSYHEPQQSYHEPQQSYHEPQQSYHEPQQSYHEPRQSYHEPQQSYHEPQQSYHEPQQSYHEPQQSYHEPQQSYHEPQQSYHEHVDNESIITECENSIDVVVADKQCITMDNKGVLNECENSIDVVISNSITLHVDIMKTDVLEKITIPFIYDHLEVEPQIRDNIFQPISTCENEYVLFERSNTCMENLDDVYELIKLEVDNDYVVNSCNTEVVNDYVVNRGDTEVVIDNDIRECGAISCDVYDYEDISINHIFDLSKNHHSVDTDKIDQAITPWESVHVMNDISDEILGPNKKMKQAIHTVLKSKNTINALKKYKR